MNGLRRQHPALFWLLLTSFLGCLVMVYVGLSLAQSYEAKVKQLEREQVVLSSLRRAPVALTAENVQAAQDFLGELELKTVRMETGLLSKGWQDAPSFTRPEDIYFDLFTMVENQRDAFTKAGIRFMDTEQFGYESVLRDQRVRLSHSLDSPEGQVQTARLHRQKQALSAVLDALAASEAVELLSVERTDLLASEDSQVLAADAFRFDQRLSLGRAGVIETYPLRLEFRGKTASLRSFIQSLNASKHSIVLRDLDVKPGGQGGPSQRTRSEVSRSPFRSFGRPSTSPPQEDQPTGVPIVEANDSVFVLYLEGYYIVPSALSEKETAR